MPSGSPPWQTKLAADPEGSRLQALLQPLTADRVSVETLCDVYAGFFNRPRLPWLGPAFFTKLIYFAGYRRGIGGVQPLILDRVVASRLPSDVGVRSFTWQWSCAEWKQYIEWAANRNYDEPDEVEMALFNGRAIS